MAPLTLGVSTVIFVLVLIHSNCKGHLVFGGWPIGEPLIIGNTGINSDKIRSEVTQQQNQILAPEHDHPHGSDRPCTCDNNALHSDGGGAGLPSDDHDVIYGLDTSDTHPQLDKPQTKNQQQWQQRESKKLFKPWKFSSRSRKRKSSGTHWWKPSRWSSSDPLGYMPIPTTTPFTLVPDISKGGKQVAERHFTIFPHAIAG